MRATIWFSDHLYFFTPRKYSRLTSSLLLGTTVTICLPGGHLILIYRKILVRLNSISLTEINEFLTFTTRFWIHANLLSNTFSDNSNEHTFISFLKSKHKCTRSCLTELVCNQKTLRNLPYMRDLFWSGDK